MPTTAVSVKLSLAEKKRLAAVAKKSKRSAHHIMREAVLDHLNQMEARLGLLAEARSAWRDYKETGRFISAEAMAKWAAEDSEDLPPAENA
jgi:predicted transcriptional regulator